MQRQHSSTILTVFGWKRDAHGARIPVNNLELLARYADVTRCQAVQEFGWALLNAQDHPLLEGHGIFCP